MYWHRKLGTRVEWSFQKDGTMDSVTIQFKRLGNCWLAVDYYPNSGAGTIIVVGGLLDCIWENGTASPE